MPRLPASERAALFGLAAAMVTGALVLFWRLTAQSPFIDEAFTVRVASRDIPALFQLVAHEDVHPPLFYLLAHFAVQSLHWPVERYRLLIAPLSLFTIFATWALARRFFGDTAAFIAALVIALQPVMLPWDRLFRVYGLLVPAAAASWLMLVKALDERDRRRSVVWWIVYAVLTVSLPYLQYLGAATIVCQCGYALAGIRTRWPVLAAAALACASLVPWLWAIRIQFPLGGYTASTHPNPIEVLSGLAVLGAPEAWVHQAWFAPLSACVLVAILAAGAVLGRKTILPWWLLQIALQFVASIVLAKALAIPRYLLTALPAVAISTGAVCASLLGTRLRLVGVAVAASFVVLEGVCASNLVLDPYYQFPDWYLVRTFVGLHETPPDVMVFDQGFPALVVEGYKEFSDHDLYGPNTVRDVDPTIRLIDARPAARVWYIENQWWYPDPGHRILRHLQTTRTVERIWHEAKFDPANEVYVLLFGPSHRTRSTVRPVTRKTV
ncbi:MAG TPA: glycosyltransferase family 39 protein [Candidatus Eremiobacteraceae bacterium]|nr:glycosyltransferase family 39 protein [Candidatus Eremiobacteraceae bacterium]